MNSNPQPEYGRRFLGPHHWGLLFIVLLYWVGIYHWVYFFNFSRLEFTAYDWPKDHAYFDTLRDSICQGRLPWHVLNKEFHDTDRFLALPETVLSPQMLLAPFLEVNQLILFQTLLMYSLGFLGCLLIRRRYQLSLLPFTTLWLLFNFNGYISSHLAVGHSMWNGYFLLSFFALFLLEMVEQPAALVPALKLALVLFAMMLQGSFHIVIWCWMLLGVFFLVNWKSWRQGLVVFGFSGALSLVRLVPAAIAFWNFKSYGFILGYPDLPTLMEAFTRIRTYQFGPIDDLFLWWEYDLYLSAAGLALLLWFGVLIRLVQKPVPGARRQLGLDLAMLVLAILCWGDLYKPIGALPLPLINAERVPSRFLIIPVVVLLVMAAIHMQRWLETKPRHPALIALLVAALLLTGYSLSLHTEQWQIITLENDPDTTAWKNPMQLVTTTRPDPLYVGGVILSALASLLALAAWIYYFLKFRRQALEPNLAETSA